MLSPLSLILLFVVLLNIFEPGTADVARVFKCPCSFTVARKVNGNGNASNDQFDFLIEHFAHPRSKFQRKVSDEIEKHSSRKVRINGATHSDSTFSYFKKINIEDTGLFRVRIRHHSTNRGTAVPHYKLQLHESAKQVTCPVVLAPDMPISEAFSTNSRSADVSIRQHRIVGGLFISPGLLPYIVSIRIPCPNGRTGCFLSCTGTLLSGRWVMTAAHCGIPEGSKVYISSRVNLRGFSVRVKRSIPHPQFNQKPIPGRQNQFDIAVLELERSVRRCCVPRPKFMRVRLEPVRPKTGAFARAAGYGTISFVPRNTTDPNAGSLRTVDLPIVNNRICKEQYIKRTGISISARRQLCAGYLEDGGCDSCKGDSGGPLVQYDGNEPVLIGVTSFGYGCGEKSFPGVYTRPSAHKLWLESTGASFRKNLGRIDQVIVNCAPGEFLPFIPGRTSSCQKCPVSMFSTGGAVRECQSCRSTLRRDPNDGAQCSCRARRGFGLLRRKCVACRPGFFSSFGMNRCMRCKSGTFSDKPRSGACKRCPGARRGSRRCRSA